MISLGGRDTVMVGRDSVMTDHDAVMTIVVFGS